MKKLSRRELFRGARDIAGAAAAVPLLGVIPKETPRRKPQEFISDVPYPTIYPLDEVSACSTPFNWDKAFVEDDDA